MNKNFLVTIALIFSLMFSGQPSKADSPDILFEAHRVAEQNGYDYTNPAVISAFAVTALIYGVSTLIGIYGDRGTKARARTEAETKLAHRNTLQAEIEANDLMIKILKKSPDSSLGKETITAYEKVSASKRAELAAIEKHLPNVQTCYSWWARFSPWVKGGVPLVAGAAGLSWALYSASSQNKTLKQLQKEKDAKEIFQPMQAMEVASRLKASEDLFGRVSPATSSALAVINTNEGAIKANLMRPEVVKERGVSTADNDEAVRKAMEKAKDPASVSGALRFAVEVTVEKQKGAKETSVEAYERIMKAEKGSKEAEDFKHMVTENFVRTLFPTIMTTSARYTFLKEATRKRIADELEMSLRSNLKTPPKE